MPKQQSEVTCPEPQTLSSVQPSGQYICCPLLAQGYGYTDSDDEINLIDLFKTIWKWKWLIILLVTLTGAGSVWYSLQLPNIYRSEATIIPREQDKGSSASAALSALGGFGGMATSILGLGGNGSLEKFETVLRSRIFSRKIYKAHSHEILENLYPQKWNSTKKKWFPEIEKIPSEQDIVLSLSKAISIHTSKKIGTLALKFDNTNPSFAKHMIGYYLHELSESLRTETLHDAAENQKFLNEQIDQVSDILLKEKIYSLLAKEIEKETFARAQKPYSFQVLDPPIVPDSDKRVAPRRSLICILSVLIVGVFSILLAFVLEYMTSFKHRQR